MVSLFDVITFLVLVGVPVIFVICCVCALWKEQLEEALRAPVVLPSFPYPQARASEPQACAICLEELRQGQLCSEVPACRHIFHEECIRVWARKNKSCPLCRARIVRGTGDPVVALADDMV